MMCAFQLSAIYFTRFFFIYTFFPIFFKRNGNRQFGLVLHCIRNHVHVYIECICLHTLYWVILPPGFFGMFQFKKFKQIRMLVMYKIVNQKKMHCLCLTLLLPCSLMQNFSEYVDVYIIQLRYMYIVLVSIEHFIKNSWPILFICNIYLIIFFIFIFFGGENLAKHLPVKTI